MDRTAQSPYTQPVLHSVVFIALFWCFWHFSGFFNVVPGRTVVSAFYPAPGLTISLITVFGWRYIPVVFIATLIGGMPEVLPSEMPPYIWVNDVRQAGVYGLAGLTLRPLLKGDATLTTTHNVLIFLAVAFGASLFSALAAMTNYVFFGVFPLAVAKKVFISFWAGDCAGILMTAPLALLAFRTWEQQSFTAEFKRALRKQRGSIASAVLVPAVVSGAAFSFIAIASEASNFGYLILLPIIWLAAVLGASLGSLSALSGNMSAAGLYSFFEGSIYTPTEIQILFAVSAGVALIIGASRNDRLHAEERARNQEREMARLSRMASIGELGTSIAHEIATPLQVASTNSQMSIKRLQGASVEDCADIMRYQTEVQNALDRAIQIHKRIRNFAKGESAELERINVYDVITDAVHMLERDIEQAKVHVRIINQAPISHIKADLVGLQQVYVNLIKNALEAIHNSGKSDGALAITLSEHEGTLEVALEDDGTGIQCAPIERIFGNFYTTRHDGLGLGLSICRTTMEGIGGSIRAENTEHGARFVTSFPLIEETAL